MGGHVEIWGEAKCRCSTSGPASVRTSPFCLQTSCQVQQHLHLNYPLTHTSLESNVSGGVIIAVKTEKRQIRNWLEV